MSTDTIAPNGFYVDPFDPELFREWSDGRWTTATRTGLHADIVERNAPHVGKPLPAPGDRARPAPPAGGSRPAAASSAWGPGLAVALAWAVVALIVGGTYVLGTQDIAYGGDAYTGIQNAGAQSVRALGWLIIATGPLAVVIALARR